MGLVTYEMESTRKWSNFLPLSIRIILCTGIVASLAMRFFNGRRRRTTNARLRQRQSQDGSTNLLSLSSHVSFT